MLKLITCTPVIKKDLAPQEESNSNNPPAFRFQVYPKGPYLYTMAVEDCRHQLSCELVLEVKEWAGETGTQEVVCHFPAIEDEAFSDAVEDDDTLYATFMIEFQMKILEQLLVFCATHDAVNLVIFADDLQAEALGIYQDFLAYKDQTLTAQGEKTEMIIPADYQTYDAWIDYMEKMNLEFHQALWREQRSNPAIRRYLKAHPFAA